MINKFYLRDYILILFFLYIQYLFNFTYKINIFFFIINIINAFYKNFYFKYFYIFLILFFINFYKTFFFFLKYKIFFYIIKKLHLLFLFLFIFFKKKYLNFYKNFFYKIFFLIFSIILLFKYYELKSYNLKYIYWGNINDIYIILILIKLLIYFFLYYKYNFNILNKIFFVFFNLNLFFYFYNICFKNNLSYYVNPLLNNFLLKLHVPFLITSYSLLIISSIISFYLLFFKKNLYISTKLEKINYYFYFLSFILYSTGNIFGSLWAKISWGFYWNWDPKEIWSLILWFFYLIWFHFYIKKKNKIINFLSILNLFLLFFLFLGINYFYKNSLHTYANL